MIGAAKLKFILSNITITFSDASQGVIEEEENGYNKYVRYLIQAYLTYDEGL